MQSYFGSSSSRRLKVFESDSEGVHFLLMRGGTSMHTDKACPRYSHHLVLRNDGTGIRGLHGDKPEHLPMRRGVMYCLDTHSPHQGLRDSRLFPMEPLVKLVVAVDRDEPLDPGECLELVTRILDTNVGDWRPNR